MLKNFKKALKRAFTITELVIVIAVIAILAAVLIPTFSNVIEKANQSAAMQNCRAAISDYGTPEPGLVVSEGKDAEKDYYYLYMNGGIHLLDGVEQVTDVTVNAAGDYTVSLTASNGGTDRNEPANWSSHTLTVSSSDEIDGVYMSKPITINGTNYVSVFVRQCVKATEADPLTNFYSTAYIYSGVYFSWSPNEKVSSSDETEVNVAMTDTFDVTVTAVVSGT